MEVEDVSNNEKYYKYGIDIIVREPGGQYYIDVKADSKMYKTNNVFFELIEILWRDRKKDIKIGWSYNKYLKYIYYVDTHNWWLYKLELNELYNLIYAKDSGQYRLIPHERYKTLGLLIPLKDILTITTSIQL